MSSLVFLDAETTGLDEHRHRAWEWAALRRDEASGALSELRYFLDVTGAERDAQALEISGFDARYRPDEVVSEAVALEGLCIFAVGSCLMLLNPWFDSKFMSGMFGRVNDALSRAQRLAPTWHYSPVDVKSFAAGALRLPPPWRSDDIARRLDIHPEDFARHGAMADCYYAMAMYDAALALNPGAGTGAV